MRTMRRRYQLGSNLEDVGDAWKFRYREYYLDEQGKEQTRRPWKYLYKREYPTKPSAKRAAVEFLTEINRPDRQLLSELRFEKFAEDWKRTDLVQYKHSARDSYSGIIDNHLIPAFGKMTWQQITAEVIQAWVSSQTDAPSSIYNRVKTLKAMHTDAKRYGKAQGNPFEGLRRPSIERGNFYFFTLEEIVAILAATPAGQKYLMMWVVAETAMRPGELAGLRKDGLEGRILKVSQSVYKGETQKPKTKNSVRRFPITQELADALREHNAGSELMFATKNGTPICMRNFLKHTLDPILRKLGIKQKAESLGLRSGTQSFRHGVATELSRRKVPIKTIQQRMGHAIGSQVTQENYLHAVEADALAAADMLGALLRPKGEHEKIQ